MAEKEIAESIYKLRSEIEHLENNNPDLRLKLEGLLDDLEDRLESSEEPNSLHLIEDMQTAITQFEVEHPTITGVLNDLMVKLSNIGI